MQGPVGDWMKDEGKLKVDVKNAESGRLGSRGAIGTCRSRSHESLTMQLVLAKSS